MRYSVTSYPRLSSRYIRFASAICFMLLRQDVALAFSLARDNAGRSIAARMAMMAITTSSSINVNPPTVISLPSCPLHEVMLSERSLSG